MIQETIIKYLVIVLVAASSVYVTHKITVDSFTSDVLKTQNAEVKAKDAVETKIETVEALQLSEDAIRFVTKTS